MVTNTLQVLSKKALRCAVVPALLFGLMLVTTGCGPGFPIMTNEQELLVNNVNRLLEENSDLKKRVTEIEESRATGSDLEDTRIALADSKAEFGRLRDEFSFVRSSLEENELAIGQLKADSDSSSERIDEISSQLGEVAASIENSTELITSLADANIENVTSNTGLKESLNDINTRLAEIEAYIKSNAKTHKEQSKEAAKSDKTAADKSKKSPAPKELYALGLKETKAKEYSKASKTFKSFLAEHPRHDLADNAQYWLGEIFYDTGEYERAVLEFDKVITKYPKGDKRAAATLKQGFSFENLGALKESRVLLETVIELYPKSSEAGIAKRRLKKLTAKETVKP